MNIIAETFRKGFTPEELYLFILESKEEDISDIEDFIPYIPEELKKDYEFFLWLRISMNNQNYLATKRYFPEIFLPQITDLMKQFFFRNPTQHKNVVRLFTNYIYQGLDEQKEEKDLDQEMLAVRVRNLARFDIDTKPLDPKNLWRGGGRGYMPKNLSAKEIIAYEETILGNNIKVVFEGDLSSIPSSSLAWVARTKEQASRYGKPEKISVKDYRVIAEDPFGGILIQKFLEE